MGELVVMMMFIWILCSSASASASSNCNLHLPPRNHDNHDFVHRCPLLTLQMNGESLERVLSSASKDIYTAVLFYESGSAFSSGFRSKFDMLSSMFPRISHIAVEKSLTIPSLFSRHGIHSLHALFIVNQTAAMRYHRTKDLRSVALFYKKTTGLDPAEQNAHGEFDDIMDVQIVPRPWYQSSWREIIVKEPYLVLAILFLMLRAFLYCFPHILSRFMALWRICNHQLTLGIFGESSQLLGRVLHLIDVERMWSKLKARNFEKGARSARVWASPLTSVSLGETSSARPASSVGT